MLSFLLALTAVDKFFITASPFKLFYLLI